MLPLVLAVKLTFPLCLQGHDSVPGRVEVVLCGVQVTLVARGGKTWQWVVLVHEFDSGFCGSVVDPHDSLFRLQRQIVILSGGCLGITTRRSGVTNRLEYH